MEQCYLLLSRQDTINLFIQDKTSFLKNCTLNFELIKVSRDSSLKVILSSAVKWQCFAFISNADYFAIKYHQEENESNKERLLDTLNNKVLHFNDELCSTLGMQSNYSNSITS